MYTNKKINDTNLSLNLDKLDKKILYQLDLNARATNNNIAKTVRASKEVVSYRIKRLVKNNVIKNFVAVLNTHAFKHLCFRIFFKFSDVSPEKEQQFIQYAADKFVWIVKVRGNWSYNTLIYAKSILALESCINEIKSTFADVYISCRVSPVTRIFHYHRSFLDEKKNQKVLTLGKETTHNTDETDQKIIKSIVNDARKSTREIAQEIECTERIVRYRLKKLEQNDIILGYRSNINVGKLGYKYFKIHFTLNEHTNNTQTKTPRICSPAPKHNLQNRNSRRVGLRNRSNLQI